MKINREALGIDLGGTNIRVARISADGEILERISEHVPRGRENQLTMIHDSVQRLMSPKIRAVGLGFPGRVRVSDGIALTAGYLDLQDIPMVALLEEQTGVPSVVNTDANMALYAEMKVGAAIGKREIAMFTIGTGIGGAIVSGGEIFYGGGTAGQLGHLTVDINGRLCNCGRKGCVETTSSGTALRNLITKSSIPESTMVEDLLAMEKNGDPFAREILDKWAGPLRLAIDSVVAMLACELVLLGGGLGKAAYQALLQVTSNESPWFNYEVKAGELCDNAGVIGAGLFALDCLDG